MDQAATVMGAANRTLDAVIARSAIVFRCICCLVVPIAALVEDPPPGSVAARNVALVAVVAWGAAVWLVCRRQQRLPAWLVLIDAALFSACAVNAAALVPERLIGNGTTWVTSPLCATAFLAAWSLAPWHGVLVTGGIAAAYVGGIDLAGKPLAGAWLFCAVLGIQLALGWVIVRYMRRTAAATDLALAKLDEAERRRKVGTARAEAAEARRITLHDAVIGTLTAVSRGGVAARARALHDRAVAALAGLGERSARGHTGAVAMTTLAAEFIDDARDLGITLRCRVPEIDLPAHVSQAVSEALREGLRNIERHAATDEADLDVATSGAAVTITLSDNGVGFTPSEESRSIGLRESVSGRMASVGGRATIVSTPGNGTSLVLTWEPTAADSEQLRPDPFGSALPDAYVAGFGRVLTYIPVCWHAGTLVMLLGNLESYRLIVVEVLAWLVLAVVAVLLAVRRGRPFTPRAAAAALVVSVTAASVAVAMSRGTGVIDKANWAIFDFSWFLVAITIHRHPRWVFALWPAVPLVNVITAFTTLDQPADAAGRMLNMLLVGGYLQVGTLLMYRVLRRQGTVASQALRRTHEIETEQAAVTAVTADRAARYRAVESDLLPFLRGLADGTIDPSDPRRQNEAWVKANTLRALIEHDRGEVSTGTIDRVVEVATAAASRGLAPTMRLAELEALPDDVADALTAVMRTVIDRAEPGEARLTLRAGTGAASATVCMPTLAAPEDLCRSAAKAARIPLRFEAVPLRARTVWLEAQWSR